MLAGLTITLGSRRLRRFRRALIFFDDRRRVFLHMARVLVALSSYPSITAADKTPSSYSIDKLLQDAGYTRSSQSTVPSLTVAVPETFTVQERELARFHR